MILSYSRQHRFRFLALLLVGVAGACVHPTLGQAPQPGDTFQSKHYRVVTHIDPERARKLARHLDAVFDEYDRRFKSFSARSSKDFPFFVFNRQQEYLDYLGPKGVNASGTSGVFFRAEKIDGLATFVAGQSSRDMEHTLQHEGFHQFAYMRISKDLPPWVNEGIAEYFGVAYMSKGRLVTGIADARPLGDVQRAIKDGQHVPLQELLNLSAQEWLDRVNKGKGAQIMYDQSWSVVHFLVESGNSNAALLEKYLRALAAGKRNADAFRDCFGKGTEDFEKAWKKYTLELEPDPVCVAASRMSFLAYGLKTLHEKDIHVTTIEELKSELRKGGFRATRHAHGGDEVFSAADDANFTLPEAKTGGAGRKEAANKREPSLKLVASKDPKLPPSIVAEGLKVKVRVNWRLDNGGGLMDEMVFE